MNNDEEQAVIAMLAGFTVLVVAMLLMLMLAVAGQRARDRDCTPSVCHTAHHAVRK
jgi:hypothetical protein